MFVAQQNQDLCTPYICFMMVLDSRVGRIQFRNHKKVQYGAPLYTASMNYWGAMPTALIFYNPEKKGFWGCNPQ